MFIIIRNHLLFPFVPVHFTSRYNLSVWEVGEGGGFARKCNVSALCQHRSTQKEAEEVLSCLHCSPDLRLVGLHLRYNSCPTYHLCVSVCVFFLKKPRHQFTLVSPLLFPHSHDFNTRLKKTKKPTTQNNNCQSFEQKLLHEVSGAKKKCQHRAEQVLFYFILYYFMFSEFR